MKLASSNADYEKVGDEIYRLREQKQKVQVENANRDELKNRMADMSAFLLEQPTAITQYDEHLLCKIKRNSFHLAGSHLLCLSMFPTC